MKQKYKSESGRSMVEMLGVLAVIGVLSVAGIAGYTTAMNKYRANELLNEASKRAVVVAMQRAQGSALSVSEFGDTGWSVTPVENKAQFTLTSPSVSAEVCKQVVAILGQSSMVRGIKSGATDIAGDTSKCSDGALQLIYNDDLSTADIASGPNHHPWQEDDEGTVTQEGCEAFCPASLVTCVAQTTCDVSLDSEEADSFDCYSTDGTLDCEFMQYGGSRGRSISPLEAELTWASGGDGQCKCTYS